MSVLKTELDSLAKKVEEMPLPTAIEELNNVIQFKAEMLEIIEKCKVASEKPPPTSENYLWQIFITCLKNIFANSLEEALTKNLEDIFSLLEELLKLK